MVDLPHTYDMPPHTYDMPIEPLYAVIRDEDVVRILELEDMLTCAGAFIFLKNECFFLLLAAKDVAFSACSSHMLTFMLHFLVFFNLHTLPCRSEGTSGLLLKSF